MKITYVLDYICGFVRCRLVDPSSQGDVEKTDIRQHRDVIIGCSVAGIAALVTLTVCLYRCRQRTRRPSAVDPELGDDQGRLVAVQKSPPVPDFCPYSPQLGELAEAGQSPTEQYAAECDGGGGGDDDDDDDVEMMKISEMNKNISSSNNNDDNNDNKTT